MNLDIKYYLSVLLRRLPLIIVITSLFAAVSISVALMLPAVYKSEARLLVESARVSGELADTTVDLAVDQQLQIVEQRLMTRSNLLAIAREFNAVPDLNDKLADEIVEDMRAATSVRRSGGRNQATFMSVGFEAQSPTIAAAVTDRMVSLVLRESVEYRTDRAVETLAFFEQEVEQLAKQLDDASLRILEFKGANQDSLPDTLEFRMTQQAQLQERMTAAQGDLVTLAEDRRRLLRYFESTGGVTGQTTPAVAREVQELANVRRELEQALTVFSEQNPRVRLLRARVEQLESEVAGLAPTEDTEDPKSQAEVLLDLQLEEIDAQIRKTETRVIALEKGIQEIQVTLDKTPQTTIALDVLLRDYNNTNEQYNAAIERLSAAQTGERIEVLSKGERITVVEQPSTPTTPSSPNRPLIAGGGTILGFLAALCIVLILELANRTVRRPADLTVNLGITPLATLPFVRTRRDIVLRRAMIGSVLVAIVCGVPALLFAVHTFYMPLDLLVDKIMTEAGI
ncbi:MAG: Wzz/FepE/Etk N-terminal domain-containing protein [Pseudomonadota bacterium]